MEEWKEYKLRDFMEFNPKIKLAKDTLARKITMDQLIPHCRDIHSWIYEPYSGGAKFENGDTIMARITPCLENGKHAYVSCLDKGEVAYGSTEYIVIRGRKDISDNAFVYYLSHYPNFKNAAIKSMVGTSGRQRAQVDVLENLIMTLPSLGEQRVIASFLKSFDDKIEVNRKINENLEQQAQALFKSWFVDFEPFKNGEFVESELGMIPKGWRVEELTSFGRIVCGKTPSKTESSYYGGNIPFIKIPDMHNKVFVELSEDNLSQLGDESQPAKRIPPYSILVSCIATVGLVCINTQESHTNQQINTIIPDLPIFRYYLYQKVLSLKDYLINLGRGGTATLNVNTKIFGSIKVVKPTDELLLEYDKLVSPLFNIIEKNQQESRRLAELRDTLLPKLMSGELKVNEIA